MPAIPWSSVPNNTHAKWWKDAGLRWNVFHALSLCCVIATNGYGGSLLGGLQAVPAWNKYFGSPKGTRLGLYSAAYFLPSAVTSYIGDYLSNRWGRRWSVIIGMLVMLVGGLINTFAINAGMWVGGRAIIGCGVGIVKVGAPVLIQEIAHPRLRPTLGSCYQGFAYLGGFGAGWMTFAGLYVSGNWSWRFPSFLQIIGPAYVMIVAFQCPESPRWLYSKGRIDEARAVLAKYHANGDLEDPLVSLEMSEIAAAKEKAEMAPKVSYLDFLRTPGNRKRLIVLIALAFSLNWMGNGIISYYLAPVLRSVGIAEPVKITLINAGLATWNLVFALTAAVQVERFGRRPLFLGSVAGMLLCYAIITGLSATFAKTKNPSVGSAVIPFLYLYFGAYSSAFTPLPVAYTVEIMPFIIRSKGVALFTSVATFGNAFNQFVNPVALQAIAWKYYFVYIGILIFYGTFIFFVMPETKGLSAEEAAKVFDGPERAPSPESRIGTSEEKPGLAEDLTEHLDKMERK